MGTAFVGAMLLRIQISTWKIGVTIVVNNHTVLVPLVRIHLQSGQALIIQITEATSQLSEMGAKVSQKPPTDEDSELTT